MKRLLLLTAVTMILGAALPWCSRVEAQVDVIRKLPASGARRGAASWREAYPEPGAVRTAGTADFSGRLSVGGRGGQNTAGEALYDVSTDSRLTLIQPLGVAGALSLDASALRSRTATAEDQDYDGSLALDFERLQLEAAGGYGRSLQPVDNVDKQETDAYVEASLSVGLLETLPMNLSYNSTWSERRDDAVSTESYRSDTVAFKTAGTVGRMGVEVDAALELEDDAEQNTRDLGTGGTIRLTVPVAESLAVQALTVPNYNRSETATTVLTSTSLESGLGILWTVLDDLQTRIQGSRVDSWAEGTGVSFEPYQTTWRAEVGLDYGPPLGLFAAPSYGIAKTVGNNLSHELELQLGWRGDRGPLREISGSGAADLTRSGDGSRVEDALDWAMALSLVPTRDMTLGGDYFGRYVLEEGSESWTHQAEASFSNAPDPLYSYRAAVRVSNNQEEASADLWAQEYQAGLTLSPGWNLNIYTVDLSETVAITDGSSGNDILSTAALNATIPLTAEIGTRLSAQWGRINRTAPGSGPGDNFQYSAGLSVAGEAAPFSFNAQYSFAHGYRGLRHDVSSDLLIPLRRGFALEGVFSLSSYDEDGSATLPFLLGLNLLYEF